MNLDNMTIYPPNSDINMRHVLVEVVLPSACICGIVGIITTLIILSHKHMATSTNTYLTGLAAADLMFLIIVSLRLWGVMVSHSDLNTWEIFTAYSEIFLRMFNLVSVWMTVMLAVERFIAICIPYKAMDMCTIYRSRCIVVFIYIAAFVCQSPHFAKYKIVTSHNEFNETEYTLHQTLLSGEILFTIIYGWVLEGLSGVIVPFVLILVLNSRLIYEIHKSTQYLKRQIGANTRTSFDISSEQMKITTMLIAMCVVFLICQAPYVLYNYLISIQAGSLRSRNHLLIMAISILLAALKSSINFVLYCWFSERFWTTFKTIMCFRCARLQKLTRNQTNGVPKITPPRNNSVSNSKETTI
ncbi:sex peptide receptor-related protein 2 [Octopus bimaculoides]|uniref:G-protein coupled receptors family 1 profile domain-containing protein n=1 Tax=Octopus bimaculoides TaxID=37653 RepID=A0A0L8FQN5_OCTBM|nr:sex peptide receptor-related protein 2 [Octopus bimaculoides]|eukprot:XP_014787772.1 PREDICTED: sex peptide receptor-like [Octopus bimaculoides]